MQSTSKNMILEQKFESDSDLCILEAISFTKRIRQQKNTKRRLNHSESRKMSSSKIIDMLQKAHI